MKGFNMFRSGLSKLVKSLMLAAAVCFANGCQSKNSLTSAERDLNRQSLANFEKPTRWQADIDKFTSEDAQNPPPKGAVLFIGSSTVRLWDTKKYFPDIVSINRGFGGSHISDSIYYADRILIPYDPRVVVFYVGDNDITAGKSPEMVCADFKAFILKVKTALPQTRIVYISIKPSIARWKLWPKMKTANALIRDYCHKQSNVDFLDITALELGPDGTPRKDLFRDGLHLNDKGYELWTPLVRPYLGS
jgi:lysophospholipase L1-like esterase